MIVCTFSMIVCTFSRIARTFSGLRAHPHDCVHILPRGPSSPSLSSSSSSLSSPLPACNNRGWFKFQPVAINVRIRTQSEHSQQQSNIKYHNQTQRQEYIPQLKLWRHKERFDQNINQVHIGHLLLSTCCCRLTSPSLRASDKKQNVLLVIRYYLMITVD